MSIIRGMERARKKGGINSLDSFIVGSRNFNIMLIQNYHFCLIEEFRVEETRDEEGGVRTRVYRVYVGIARYFSRKKVYNISR